MFGPIHPLTSADLPGCLALARDREWLPEERKWRLLFDIGTVYGVRDQAGDLVGVTVLTCHGAELATIGMLLVAARYGRRGLGRGLMTHALAQAGRAPATSSCWTGRPPAGWRGVTRHSRWCSAAGRFPVTGAAASPR